MISGKSKKGRLRAIKKLVTRDGKTFIATYYVSDESEIEDADPIKEEEVKSLETKIPDITVGDYVNISGLKSKGITGIVKSIGSSLYKGERYYYLTVETKDGVKTIASQKLSVEILSEPLEIDKLEKKTLKSLDELKLSDLKFGSRLGGSSVVELMSDENGNKFVVKSPNDMGGIKQLEAEVTADKLYRAIGIDVPDSKIIGGKKVSEFIEGKVLKSASSDEKVLYKKIQKGFVMDVLLRNQDVIGDAEDNILVDKNNNPYRIDNGSCFEFRAKGGEKTWGTDKNFLIQDFDDFRNESYPVGRVFKDISLEEVKNQILKIKEKKDEIANILSPVQENKFSLRLSNLEEHIDELILEKKGAEREKDYDHEKYSSKVTQDYFKNWDSFQIEGNKRLKDTIKKNIISKEKDWDNEFKSRAKEHGISVDQYKRDMQEMTERVIRNSEFFITVELYDVFKNVLNEGRFKTLFETGTGGGSISTSSRALTELKRFGIPLEDGIDIDKRPVSGYFTMNKDGVINDKGKIPPPNAVSQYGNIMFKVKRSSAMKKATITFRDSLGSDNLAVATPVSKPHFTAVGKSFKSYDDLKKFLDTKSIDAGIGDAGESYTEVQYHNQLLLGDIESIHIPHSLGERKITDFINNFADWKASSGNKDIKVVVF